MVLLLKSVSASLFNPWSYLSVKRVRDERGEVERFDDSYILPEILNPDIDPGQLLSECEFDSAIAIEHIVLAATSPGLG